MPNGKAPQAFTPLAELEVQKESIGMGKLPDGMDAPAGKLARGLLFR